MSREIWDKNIAAMRKWYPSFVELFLKSKDNEEDLEVCREVSRDGELIFRIRKGERRIYLGGKRNAKEPVEIWLQRLGRIHKYAPVFLFGAGSGAYLKALAQHTEKEVNLVVYEPSVTIFRAMLQETDLSEELQSRPIAFLVEGVNETEFEPVMNRVVAVESLNFLREEIHPGYRALFGEQLAILVAAGPSLNKNIQELRQAKNKAFILAVDTAIKPLMKAGIVPDAFLTIDPHKLLALVEIDGAENIPVIAPTSARHALLERQKAKKIFYSDGYLIPRHIYNMHKKEFPGVATGGSVACNCFSLLYKMGFDTIIMVGQDLAYTNHKSHADGTFEEVMPEKNTDHMIMVKGNYEEQVPTLLNLRMYLDWFHKYVTGVKKRYHVRVINATEGGAWIEGTELMTLKDAIVETCTQEISFETCIARMKSAFSREEYEKAVEYLHSIPGEYEEIETIARQLHDAFRQLGQIGSSKSMNKDSCKKQLAVIKKLSGQCSQKDAFQLIEATVPDADFIIRSEYYYENGTLEEETREIARKGMKYSELLEQCAALLKDIAKRELRKEDMDGCGKNSESEICDDVGGVKECR